MSVGVRMCLRAYPVREIKVCLTISVTFSVVAEPTRKNPPESKRQSLMLIYLQQRWLTQAARNLPDIPRRVDWIDHRFGQGEARKPALFGAKLATGDAKDAEGKALIAPQLVGLSNGSKVWCDPMLGNGRVGSPVLPPAPRRHSGLNPGQPLRSPLV